MKYLIYKNNTLQKVDEQEYEQWMEDDVENYLLPIYKAEKDGVRYYVDTDYQGAFEEGAECCPFVLYYTIDHPSEEPVEEEVEYFDTWNELLERRSQLIKTIEQRIGTVSHN